jgi:hypothetical protein
MVGLWLLGVEDTTPLWVCSGLGLAGALAWLGLVLPSVGLAHYWEAGGPSAGILLRLSWAAGDVAKANYYQLAAMLPSNWRNYEWVMIAGLAAVVIWLWKDLPVRWVGSMFLLTALPLFVILLIRRQPGVELVGRYAYQSYTFWAVTLGALLDGALARWETHPRWKAALAMAAAMCGALYWTQQVQAARHEVVLLGAHATAQERFWRQWKDFFQLVSDHRVALGKPLRLPEMEAHPQMGLHLIYSLCHPRGLPGILLESGQYDEEEYWREMEWAKPRLPGFEPYRPSRH